MNILGVLAAALMATTAPSTALDGDAPLRCDPLAVAYSASGLTFIKLESGRLHYRWCDLRSHAETQSRDAYRCVESKVLLTPEQVVAVSRWVADNDVLSTREPDGRRDPPTYGSAWSSHFGVTCGPTTKSVSWTGDSTWTDRACRQRLDEAVRTLRALCDSFVVGAEQVEVP